MKRIILLSAITFLGCHKAAKMTNPNTNLNVTTGCVVCHTVVTVKDGTGAINPYYSVDTTMCITQQDVFNEWFALNNRSLPYIAGETEYFKTTCINK